MSDPINALTTLSGVSDGGLKLLKKIPIIGDWIRYKEGQERIDEAIDTSFASEQRILNDPAIQLAFINSFEPEKREAAIGHIIGVQQGHNKHINVTEILMQTVDMLKDEDSPENEEPIHIDWWMLWVEKAQMTSDPVKQDAFSKILARETIQPGIISPKTVRVLADLPVSDIELLREASSFFSSDGYFYIADLVSENNSFLSLRKMRLLNESSLMNFSTGLGEHRQMNTISIRDCECITLTYLNYVIILWNTKKRSINYQATLSREGYILRDSLGFKCDYKIVRLIAEDFHKRLGIKVSVNKLVSKDQVDLNSLEIFEVKS